jgi:indole-3-glycerol phosphate synthase
MTILDKIVANKKNELAAAGVSATLNELEGSRFFDRKIISLSESVLDRTRSGIIAEFKRKSPSKGNINCNASVAEVAEGYYKEGAAGVSILTENHFFGGSNDDLKKARDEAFFPILRKDFIISEYQVVEAKAIGADAILIIAAILERSEILQLSRLARSIGLEVLLEIHEKGELDKVNEYINIIGVNNRDLRSFEVNTSVSLELADSIPAGFARISESGISSPQDIKSLRDAGYDGFLIGERFMAAPDPVRAFSGFVKSIKSNDVES